MSSLPDDLSKLEFDNTDELLPLDANLVELLPATDVEAPLAKQNAVANKVPAGVALDKASVSSGLKSGAQSAPVATATATGAETENAEDESTSKKSWFSGRSTWVAIPSWAISFLVHVGLILILAAITLDPVANVLNVMTVSDSAPAGATPDESFDIDATAKPLDISSEDVEEVPEIPTNQVSEVTTEVKIETQLDLAPAITLPNLTSQLAPSDMLSAQTNTLRKSLSSRSASMRREMLERFGGTGKSEEAVAFALQWLADHQLPDGSWSFLHVAKCRGACDHPGTMGGARNAATGLALMTFFGAGQTHLQGTYQELVGNALAYLIKSMKVEQGELPTGSWYGNGDTMYGHGIAAIAICEAYAMTGDPALAEPAQLSINFIAYAQNPVLGGWQYAPREGSDTSVAGWQIMAMKSAAMGGLVVPMPTLYKAEAFLTNVQMNDGAYYGYDQPTSDIEGRRATTACGLLCRMYMGWKKTNPALKEGVEFLAARGPNPTDMYYNYYATQVLKQHGGDLWEAWNNKMRDQLVNSQVKEGHARGSWYVEDHGPGDGAAVGGRHYLTCMSTMILEVYYRHMPIYGDQTDEDSFKL